MRRNPVSLYSLNPDTESLLHALAVRISKEGLYLPWVTRKLRNEAIAVTLERKKGNRNQTAKQLGINPKTLWHIMNRSVMPRFNRWRTGETK